MAVSSPIMQSAIFGDELWRRAWYENHSFQPSLARNLLKFIAAAPTRIHQLCVRRGNPCEPKICKIHPSPPKSFCTESMPPKNIRVSLARFPHAIPLVAILAVWPGLSGCDGLQSTLNAAGTGASQISQLFYWMSGGAAIIWLVVIGSVVYALRINPKEHREKLTRILIIGGGIVFPVIVLAGLLTYGLSMMPKLMAAGDGLKIAVSGEQWWWRVHYYPPNQDTPVISANEIRLPVNQRIEFELTSADVIHSFWIPSIGGKIDMIPGRTNRLVLEPTKTGVFRGACAEYCGTAHALMAFSVVVMEPEAFSAWLVEQAAPAQAPVSDLAQRGQRLFLNNGCGACHRVAGTAANGSIGPDLTHVGSRLSLGAGILPTDLDGMARWISHTNLVKPDVKMPAYPMLDAEQLKAIGSYLLELK